MTSLDGGEREFRGFEHQLELESKDLRQLGVAASEDADRAPQTGLIERRRRHRWFLRSTPSNWLLRSIPQ